MKKIALFLHAILLLLLLSYGALAQQKDNIKEYKNPAALQWIARSIACNAACISGDCDKGNVCANFDAFKEAYKKCGIDNAFYIKEERLFLKSAYKKYFLGNTVDTKYLNLLSDDNDRFMVYIIGKPNILLTKTINKEERVLRVNSAPISLADLADKADLQLCKIPEEFPDTFEVGIESARYCNTLVCDVWNPHHRMYLLKQEMALQKYPFMPLLIDTVSGPTPVPYSVRKNITLKIQFPRNKNQFVIKEIIRILDSLNEPPFVVKFVSIKTFPSMHGDSIQNIRQQKALAESFLHNLSALPEGFGLRSKVDVGDAWQHFKQHILLTNFYYLADSGERVVRKKLMKDKALLDRLTPALNELSMATIEMDVEFDPKKYPEIEYWQYKMIHAVDKNDMNLAISYQKALIRLFAAGKIPASKLVTYNVPMNPYYLTLLNNQCAFMGSLPEQKARLETLRQIDPNNPLVKFNYLAVQLNEVREYQEDSLRDAMLFLMTEFNTINNSSIPNTLYQILQARFYTYLTANKKDRRLQSYNDIKNTSKVIPANEAIKLADDFAHIRRYDIAAPVLLDHYDKIPPEQKDLIAQYALRLLYYGRFSGQDISEETYLNVLKKLFDTDKKMFVYLFDTHQVSYLFLANDKVRNLYVEGSKEGAN